MFFFFYLFPPIVAGVGESFFFLHDDSTRLAAPLQCDGGTHTHVYCRGGAYARGLCLEKYTINIHARNTRRNGHRSSDQWRPGEGGAWSEERDIKRLLIIVPCLFRYYLHKHHTTLRTRACDRYFTIIENTIPRRPFKLQSNACSFRGRPLRPPCAYV